MSKKILCVPLDPVHDVGIKIIKAELDNHGFDTELLPPDLPMEVIAKKALQGNYDFILVSRTLGYGVAELLARFADILDNAGVRNKARIVLGGKPITPELAAELGYDKGFGEHSSIEDLVAYLEGKEIELKDEGLKREKKDFTLNYDYNFYDSEIENLLNEISEKILHHVKNLTSPGIERYKIKREILKLKNSEREKLLSRYFSLCDEQIKNAYSDFSDFKGVRKLTDEEISKLKTFLESKKAEYPEKIQHNDNHPLIFKFLGSGCPVMDLAHGKITERWGVNGFLIINPSWEARYEGLLTGLLTHENDGTITTFENLKLLKDNLDKSTFLTVRAHRGLNTPETVLLAGEAKADMVKINLVYGSLGAGTDPERLAVDGIESIKIASEYNMPFDIPGNDELSGVPAWKTLAGLLINVMLGKKLKARPILKPLFCYGPHIVINGLMKNNFVDYNSAKINVLKKIVNSPIWPGEPIAFMTQSEERVQSANSTSYHAALAAFLKVDAITIASTDEAYSRGPICITSRIDSIRAVKDAFRFTGDSAFQTSEKLREFENLIYNGIVETLKEVNRYDNLIDAIHGGALGNKDDGAYPGTFGKGTVKKS